MITGRQNGRERPVQVPSWQVAGPHDVGGGFGGGFGPPPIKMYFTSFALDELLATVGSQPPETGAKLFGPKDRAGVDRVVFDVPGSWSASRTVYAPNVEWGARQIRYHLDEPEDAVRLWTGDGHSHPGSNGIPSVRVGHGLGDLGYAQRVFEENEWMKWFYMPILTGAGGDDTVTIWPWIVFYDAPDRPRLAEFEVCDACEFPPRDFNPEWERRRAAPDNRVAGSGNTPPVAAEEVDMEVDMAAGSDTSCRHASRTSGSRTSGSRTSGEEPVAAQGAPTSAPAPRIEGPADSPPPGRIVQPRNVPLVSAEFRPRYMSRASAATSPGLSSKWVCAVGAGMGSCLLENLGRSSGIAGLRVCDFDTVELLNLVRTSYRVTEVGLLKVDALAIHLAESNPALAVEVCPYNVCALSSAQQDELVSGTDLIIAGTDSFAAQARLNRLSVKHRIPALFIGIHAGARGGRVIYSIPGETPCYRCAARERYAAAEHNADAVHLPGQHGALVDGQFIDTVALKVVLALLDRGQDSPAGRFFANLHGRNDIVVRTSPEYDWGNGLWDAVLGDLPTHPKEYAREIKESVLMGMEAIALQAEFDPQCPDCGHLQQA